MSLRLPILASVDRSLPIEPFLVADPRQSVLMQVYGALPGDPPPLLSPICMGRGCSSPPGGSWKM